MAQDNNTLYKNLVKGLGQVLAVSRLYSYDHPAVKTKSKEVFEEVISFISTNGNLVFSESAEATLIVNGEELKSEDSLMARFGRSLRSLEIGSIEVKAGLTLNEFYVFVDLLNNADSLREKNSIKEFLKVRKVRHISPSFASYKLINEHEIITKDGSVIRTESLSPEAIKNFTSDLNSGEVNKKIKEGNQIYQILAHDPEILSRVVIDNMKDKDQHDKLTKILWLIGDYLIDEIQSAKQGETNCRILNELKDKILILDEEKQIKAPLTRDVYKTFTAINTALQIASLISLYQRNRKELASLIDRLKEIVKDLSPESQLYQKTKEAWDKIDHTNLDTSPF